MLACSQHGSIDSGHVQLVPEGQIRLAALPEAVQEAPTDVSQEGDASYSIPSSGGAAGSTGTEGAASSTDPAISGIGVSVMSALDEKALYEIGARVMVAREEGEVRTYKPTAGQRQWPSLAHNHTTPPPTTTPANLACAPSCPQHDRH